MPQEPQRRPGERTPDYRQRSEKVKAAERETARQKEGKSVGAPKEKPKPKDAPIYGHEDFSQAWGSRQPAFIIIPQENPYGLGGGIHSVTPGAIGSPPQIAPVAPGTNLSEQWNLQPQGGLTPEMLQQMMQQFQISQAAPPQYAPSGGGLTGAGGGAMGSLG